MCAKKLARSVSVLYKLQYHVYASKTQEQINQRLCRFLLSTFIFNLYAAKSLKVLKISWVSPLRMHQNKINKFLVLLVKSDPDHITQVKIMAI